MRFATAFGQRGRGWNLSPGYLPARNRARTLEYRLCTALQTPNRRTLRENPNRLQHYYQFQVLLKPSPKDIQQLYLGSLQFLGLDLLEHDIRFVEDNWESPTLGAWGLGWEIWLNGMEITQFTYFQQVGDWTADP